jgi:hypothetical protein
MGAGLSRGTQGISREALLKSTQNNRDFLNKLFQVMLQKLTPEDVLRLGKAQTCSSYVFLMADSMHKLFDDLRIRPKRDRDSGIILFQKLDSLKAQTAESRELCLFVSYFFIRIFQIFGSLAITILDDPGAGQILGAVRMGVPQQPRQAGPAGWFGAAPQRIPGTRGTWLGQGGAEQKYFLSGKAAAFRDIRNVFEEPTLETTSRGQPRLLFPFAELPSVVLIPDRIDSGGKAQNLRIDVGGGGHLYGNLSIQRLITRRTDYPDMRVTLNNFTLSDSTKDQNIVKLINQKLRGYSLPTFQITTADSGASWISGQQSFPQKLEAGIEKLLTIISELEMRPEAALTELAAVPRAQRVAFAKGLDGLPAVPRAYRAGLGLGVAGQPRVGLAGVAAPRDVAVSKPFQNEYIVNVLKQLAGSKVTNFCVARALQLLDANTLYNPKVQQSISGVCKGTFEPVGASIPVTGQPLDRIPGFKATEQLFYTVPSLDQRNEFQLRVGDLNDYATFLKEMGDMFGKPTRVAGPVTGLDKILARDPQCPTTAVNKYLQIQDPVAVKKILGIVGAMFGKQKEHTEKAIKFLTTQLFTVQKRVDPVTRLPGMFVDLSPRLLKNGLEELSRVSKEARELLISYYKGCEDLYQKGAKEVLSAKSVPVA